MAEEKKVLFVPKSSVKERTFKSGEELVTVLALSFKAEELYDFVSEHANAKGYINFDIKKRKEVGPYGDTHSVTLNDYVKKDDAPF